MLQPDISVKIPLTMFSTLPRMGGLTEVSKGVNRRWELAPSLAPPKQVQIMFCFSIQPNPAVCGLSCITWFVFVVLI